MSDSQINIVKIPFRDQELVYEASNQAVLWRAQTLYQKEPDTVAWISQFKPGEVFFDIGANVGMYTVLAGRGMGARVFAFEPEAQNFALLNRNLVYNKLQQTCIAFPLALTDEVKVDRLYLSQYGLGGSCHTFGESLDFHLKERPAGVTQGCVAYPLDQLVADGVVPQPEHIKIDVDGLEHLVLAGARKVLEAPCLKSVLIELNTHLPEHRQLIDGMQTLGFSFEQRQVDVAVRREGNFEGIGNYIFTRPEAGMTFAGLSLPVSTPVHCTDAVKRHVTRKFETMDIGLEPYPHFYVTDLFPVDYYQQMLAMKPGDDEVVSINSTGRTSGFVNRFVIHLGEALDRIADPAKRGFWRQHYEWFCSEELMVSMIKRFRTQLAERGVRSLEVFPEAMFMRDKQGYGLGPHTDNPQRLMSMMVYMPQDADHSHLGTSVYRPRDSKFTCLGTKHYPYDGFDNIYTAPYLPNSAFGFFKTENSFHGVETMQEAYVRDTLVYIIKHKQAA